jgi:uncharacterized protein (TIGR03437 family)
MLAASLAVFGIRAETSGQRQAPSYSAASIVNAASQVAGQFAPNTLATLYGTGLAWTTRAMAQEDIRGDRLPTVLAGTGLRILVNNMPAYIYYVSPAQVNFLFPSNLLPGQAGLQLVLEGRAGPLVEITLGETAPGLFCVDGETVIATRVDGSLITREQRAQPGEIIVLYATGLGQTTPSLISGVVPLEIAFIQRRSELRITINGEAVPSENILYSGISPGWAGLYQINLRLPDAVDKDPEIRIELGGRITPEGLRIPLEPE